MKKPSFGREGDTVEICKGNGEKVDEDSQKTYQVSLPVFQQFIKLPETTVRTEKDLKRVHYMYGCFILMVAQVRWGFEPVDKLLIMNRIFFAYREILFVRRNNNGILITSHSSNFFSRCWNWSSD